MTDTPLDPSGVEASDDDDLDPVDEWLQFAADDLRAARTLSASDDIPPPIPCFHAQQAAEKALKAVLIVHGVNPPKVHVLGKLYDQLPETVKARFEPDDLARLDPWAVAGRYPGDVPEIARGVVSELITLAATVYATCDEVITGVRETAAPSPAADQATATPPS